MSGNVSEKLVLERVLPGTREEVFAAWSEPERLARWWGPKGMPFRIAHFDLIPGGMFHYAIALPDGTEMFGKFAYVEITQPERLVFVVSFADAEAATLPHPASPDWPLNTLSTVLFKSGEKPGSMLLTMIGEPYQASEIQKKTFLAGHESLRSGLNGTLDQLEEYLQRHG